MKAFFLCLLVLLPFNQEFELDLLIPQKNHTLFPGYENLNFRQQVQATAEGLRVTTVYRKIPVRALANKLRLNHEYLATLPRELHAMVVQVTADCRVFSSLLKKLAHFFQEEMEYSKADAPQDALSVAVRRSGHCLGFSNLAVVILNAVSISSEIVPGLYLEEQEKGLEPVAHVWLEINLPEAKGKIFFDPQHQIFSHNYLLVDNNLKLDETEKFPVRLLKRSRRLSY